MKATIHLSDGGELSIEDFDSGTALDMRDELDRAPFLTFEMDDATVIVNRDHIVRIDFEEGA